MSAIRSIKKRKLMKYIINTILLVFTACGINKSKEIDQIKNVLHTQQTAWNNGNIDAFMLGTGSPIRWLLPPQTAPLRDGKIH
jgi:hypothetical protein